MTVTHNITHARRPESRARLAIPYVVLCSCGWRHTETSRQNALARAAKMKAAVRKHLRETAEKDRP